jgi:hypothetical protein
MNYFLLRTPEMTSLISTEFFECRGLCGRGMWKKTETNMGMFLPVRIAFKKI